MSKTSTVTHETASSHFGTYVKLSAKELAGADLIVVLYNEGYGLKPWKVLLPHQLYEKDVIEKLDELRFDSQVLVAPIHSSKMVEVGRVVDAKAGDGE